jgi:hypothetical protein
MCLPPWFSPPQEQEQTGPVAPVHFAEQFVSSTIRTSIHFTIPADPHGQISQQPPRTLAEKPSNLSWVPRTTWPFRHLAINWLVLVAVPVLVMALSYTRNRGGVKTFRIRYSRLMARIGRPPTNHPRTHAVPVRLNDPELDLIRAAAERAGQPVGVWARERLLAAAKRAR